MTKTKLVTLESKFGSGKAIKIKVPHAAEAPFHLTAAENVKLRRKARLIVGDYFKNVDVGY